MAEAVGDADILIFVLPYKVCSCWFSRPFSIFIASTPPKLNSVFGIGMAIFTALNLLYV